jgi:hypothetical protein
VAVVRYLVCVDGEQVTWSSRRGAAERLARREFDARGVGAIVQVVAEDEAGGSTVLFTVTASGVVPSTVETSARLPGSAPAGADARGVEIRDLRRQFDELEKRLVSLERGVVEQPAAVVRETAGIEPVAVSAVPRPARPPTPVTPSQPSSAAPAARRPALAPASAATQAGGADWERWAGTHLLALGGAVFVILGGAFFVALAISSGWLTPPRQVGLALVAGLALGVAGVRTYRADERPRALLGQSLAGAGGALAVLGLVAAARIYDPPVMPAWVSLLGTGIVGLFLVACAVRWHARATAALGITTALVAPPLVGAPATLGSALFVALALVMAGTVVIWRGWPWLSQVGLWLTAPQLAWWLGSYHDRFVSRSASTGLAVAVALVVGGWWLLVAAPGLVLEWRGGRRLPPVTLILGAGGLATLIGFGVVAADEHPYTLAARLVGVVLVALNLSAAVVLWRRARAGALLLVAAGGAIAGLTAATIFGPAGQTLFWALEWVALYAIARRQRDTQTLIASGLFVVAALARALTVLPPAALAVGSARFGSALVVALAVAAAPAACAWVDRDEPGRSTAWLLALLVAGVYFVQALVVSLVSPTPGLQPVDQAAQFAASAALLVLLAVIVLALRLRAPLYPRHGVALVLATLLAVKVELVDVLQLGPHHPIVAVAGSGLVGGLLLVTVVCGRSGPVGESSAAPPRTLAGRATAGIRTWLAENQESATVAVPAAVLALVIMLAYVGLQAFALGSGRMGSALLLGVALVAALLVAAAVPDARRRIAIWHASAWRERAVQHQALAVVLALVGLGVLTAVSLVSPHAGSEPVSQRAQVAASVVLVAGWLAILALARLTALSDIFVREPAAAGWPVAAKIVAVDVVALGPHGAGLAVDAVALMLAGVVCLRVERPDIGRAGPATLPAASALALGGAIVAGGLGAIAYGSSDAGRAVVALLAAAALATAAVRRMRTPESWRRALVVALIATAVWAASIATVTVLTPEPGSDQISRSAQLGLSLVWAAAAVALIAFGLVRHGPLGTTARRCGIPLLGLAVAKVLAYDTALLGNGQRAALFLAVGALLLLGAYLYTKLVKTLDQPEDGPRPPAPRPPMAPTT